MIKNKIAISIDNALLGLVDNKIDGSMIRSRSQAIEYYLKKGLGAESITTAVILMKGSHQHVALRAFKSKRLIEKQIEFFKENGISKIFLITYNPSKELREALIDSQVEIVSGSKLGNALSLLTLKKRISKNFVVMSGDTFNKFDIVKMMNKHNSLNKIATMGLMTREKSSVYGNAILDGDFIIDFKEKTKSSHIVNAGIYIFKPTIFELLGRKSLEMDIFPRLAKIDELVGFITYGEYEHFG